MGFGAKPWRQIGDRRHGRGDRWSLVLGELGGDMRSSEENYVLYSNDCPECKKRIEFKAPKCVYMLFFCPSCETEIAIVAKWTFL